jgi:hypothetical protein
MRYYAVSVFLPNTSIKEILEVKADCREEAIRIAVGRFIIEHCQPEVEWAKAVR